MRFSVQRVEAPLHRLEIVLGCVSIAIGVWVVARASGGTCSDAEWEARWRTEG